MFVIRDFLVPQIEYPLGGNNKKGSHVYFLLIVAMLLLLWCHIVLFWHHITIVAPEQHLYQTIVQFDKTIVLPQKSETGSVLGYHFCYCPLVGILFEVLSLAEYIFCKITKYISCKITNVIVSRLKHYLPLYIKFSLTMHWFYITYWKSLHVDMKVV